MRLALQRHGLFAVDVHRATALAPVPGSEMPNGVLRFAGTVDHAAHHRPPASIRRRDTGCATAASGCAGRFRCPAPVPGTRRGGAAAAGTGGDLRSERAPDPVPARFPGPTRTSWCDRRPFGRQGDAYRVADAFLQQNRQGGCRGNDALAPMPPRSSQVQWVIALRCEIAIDRNQILHPALLARQNNLVARPSPVPRPFSPTPARRRPSHGASHLGLFRLGETRVCRPSCAPPAPGRGYPS